MDGGVGGMTSQWMKGGGAKIRTNLRIHFRHRHVQDTIVIPKEGKRPHPCCPDCDIFVPWAALNRSHPTTALCVRRAEQKRQRLEEGEVR